MLRKHPRGRRKRDGPKPSQKEVKEARAACRLGGSKVLWFAKFCFHRNSKETVTEAFFDLHRLHTLRHVSPLNAVFRGVGAALRADGFGRASEECRELVVLPWKRTWEKRKERPLKLVFFLFEGFLFWGFGGLCVFFCFGVFWGVVCVCVFLGVLGLLVFFFGGGPRSSKHLSKYVGRQQGEMS